ncbi:hypothetical protein [Erwinia pyrifoliae]|nr:hypothetical protein [Erwinia pyrifoliae]MCT2387442.1 hypothetical protein [Erwinia pyrifoliae]
MNIIIDGGRVKTSGAIVPLTARPPFYALPRNEKIFSGLEMAGDDQNQPI